MDENCGIMTYKLEVQKDENGELYFEFPDELLNQMGWDAGDQLLWKELPNGNWTIEKDNGIQPEDNDNEY